MKTPSQNAFGPVAAGQPQAATSLLIWDLADDHALAIGLKSALASCFDSPSVATITSNTRGGVDGESLQAVASTDAIVPVVEPCCSDRLVNLLSPLRKHRPELPVLVATREEPGVDLATLWNPGVSDLLLAPFRQSELEARLGRLIGQRQPPDRVREQLRKRLGLARLIGESAVFRTTINQVPMLADCDATVLICGETGTGKEVFARAIHYLGSRAGGPFVAVNCGALPLELVENELFGHEAGAYTGAGRSAPGLIQQAEGGTLLLDEIDCLPAAAQVKLLRFLQDKEYRPLGSGRARQADVRLIAASNDNVASLVEAGKLRRDLYYRLSVLPLILPPLRQRGEDIILLAHHFLARYSAEMERLTPRLAPDALAALMQHDWPGNVRELEHVMERAVVLADGSNLVRRCGILLDGEQGGDAGLAGPSALASFKEAKRDAVNRFERSYVKSMLLAYDGNITHAALAAGKHRRAFFELIRKHGMNADRYRSH